MDEFLSTAPQPDLLETNIAGGSYNKAQWWSSDVDGGEGEQFTDHKRRVEPVADLDPLSCLTGLSDFSSLDAAASVGRTNCELCFQSRRLFCYTCHVPLPATSSAIPRLDRLPLKVDVVKHPCEVDGKSTATHAKIICPNDVRIFDYPTVPDYDASEENVVLAYPEGHVVEDAGSAEALSKCSRVVFIDATWSQAKAIARDPRLDKLPRVKIKSRKTAFWRPQKGKSEDYLATIEAIYYFLRDYHESHLGLPYAGEYDNMLFLFKFIRDKLLSQSMNK